MTKVTGTPFADKVTIGALRKVATAVSPNRIVPQPGAAATGCWAAYPATDTTAVVRIAPMDHRFMRDEVTFGATRRKKSDVSESLLSGIVPVEACLRGPRTVSKPGDTSRRAAAAVIGQRTAPVLVLRRLAERRFFLRRTNRRKDRQ